MEAPMALRHLSTHGFAALTSDGRSSETTSKRRRRSLQCQIVGCGCDLSEAGRYFQKKRVCKACMQTEAVQRTGHGDTLWRYCQQCGKLETLDMFASRKRSCKKALDRRRATSGAQNTHTSPARSRGSLPQRQQRDQHSDSESPRSCSGDEGWGLLLAAPPSAATASPALLQHEAPPLLQQQPLEMQLSWCGSSSTTAGIAAAAAAGCHSPPSPAADGAAMPAVPSPLFSSSGSPVSSGASLTAGGGPAVVAEASADETLTAAAHLAEWFSGSDAMLQEEPQSEADAAMVDLWLAELQLLPAQAQLPQAACHLPPAQQPARPPPAAAAAVSDLNQLEHLIEQAMLDAAAATAAATSAAGAARATSSCSSGSTSEDSGSLPAGLAAQAELIWPAVVPMPATTPMTSPFEALLGSAVAASSAAAVAANQVSHAARVLLLRQQYEQLQSAVEGVRRLMQQVALHATAAGPVPAASVGPGLSLATHLNAQRFPPQLFPGLGACHEAGAFN